VEIKDWKVRSPPNLLPHTLPNLRYKIRQKATYFLADEPQGIIDLSAVSVMKALGSRWKLKSEKSAHCQIYHTHYQIYDTKYAKKQRTPSLMSHEALLIFLPGLWLRCWAVGGNWSLKSRLTAKVTTIHIYQIYHTKYGNTQCISSLMSHEALSIFLPCLWLRCWAPGEN